ncbi:MAG: hypothetical protein KGL39_28510 [Patescibacteria group bacterium]|nr:hypothetical protein [Patescibacteria group bacterium]
MIIALKRDQQNLQETMGVLRAGKLTLQTIEQPWDDNRPDHSCVPVGLYQLFPYYSPKHQQWTWCLHNPALNIYATPDLIPAGKTGRSCCEIHAANVAAQLEGCIAPGLARGQLAIPPWPLANAVLSSREAFDQLVGCLAPNGVKDADSHSLIISGGNA